MKIALDHSDWVEALQVELGELERNEVWSPIPTPCNAYIIGMKLVFLKK